MSKQERAPRGQTTASPSARPFGEEGRGLRRLLIGYGIFSAAVVLFYAFVCTPVNLYLISDIAYWDTPFSIFWDYLMDAVNYLYFWGGFAFLLVGCERFSFRGGATLFCVYLAASLIRYPFDLLSNYMMWGFPAPTIFVSDELGELLVNIGLDFLLGGVALLILFFYGKKRVRQGISDAQTAFRPFRLNLPTERTALWLALIPATVKILTRIRYDQFYNAHYYTVKPSLGDLIEETFLFYLIDLLMIPVGYLAVSGIRFLAVRGLRRREEKKSAQKSASEPPQ